MTPLRSQSAVSGALIAGLFLGGAAIAQAGPEAIDCAALLPAGSASASDSVGDDRAAFPERLELPGAIRAPLERAESRPEVSVLIEGQGPFRLLFDTGASGLMLDRSVADRLGLATAGTGVVSSPLGDGFEVERVRIERIDLAGATLHGVIADRWDGPPVVSGADPPVGILGPSLFRDALLTLDFDRGELRLDRGRLSAGDPGVVAFCLDHELPLFRLDVAGVPLPAHLDSGNSSALVLPLEARLPLAGEPVVVGRARLVDAEVSISSATVRGTIRLGPWTLENPPVLLLPGAPAANLGIGLLRGVVLTLDQRSRLARIALPGEG